MAQDSKGRACLESESDPDRCLCQAALVGWGNMQKFPGNDPIWKSRRVLTTGGEFVHSDQNPAKEAPPRTGLMPGEKATGKSGSP